MRAGPSPGCGSEDRAEKAAYCIREARSWKDSLAYGEKHPLFWKKCQQLINLGNNVLKVKCDFLE